MSITQFLGLPSVCALCNQYHQGRLAVCMQCKTMLQTLGPACKFCAQPLPLSDFLFCGQCTRKKPHFDQVFTAYRYVEPLRSLLQKFKYQESLYLKGFLSELMLDGLCDDLKKTQCLIPVPIHPKRMKQRGFNQAAELAKNLSQYLHIPYNLFLCKKTTNTKQQARLNGQQRRQNIRDSFTIDPCCYQHVTLIDDLFTTGSTVNELAKIMKRQGVKKVTVWCIARATFEFI